MDEYKDIIDYITNPVSLGITIVGVASIISPIYCAYRAYKKKKMQEQSKLENTVQGDEK